MYWYNYNKITKRDFIKKNNKNVNIILGNVNNDVLETINEKFDAISNIGA